VSVVFALTVMRIAGWELEPSLVVGLSLVSTSTVVLLRQLMERSELDSLHARTLISWSIVEDLSTVAILVMLPTLALVLAPAGAGATEADLSATGIAFALSLALGKGILFSILMLAVGSRLIPRLLNVVA